MTGSNRNRSRPSSRDIRRSLDHSRARRNLGNRRSLDRNPCRSPWPLERRARGPRFRCRIRRMSPS